MLPFGPTTPAGACTVFGKDGKGGEGGKRGSAMRERKAGARENEKTKVHRWEVEGKARRKKDREEVDGGRLRDGKVVDRGGSRTGG